MKPYSFKCLFAAVAAIGVSAAAHADFTNTFDDNTTLADWSQNVAWSAGPVGWADKGCAQSTDTAGGYTVGGGGGPVVTFSGATEHLADIQSLITAGGGYVNFEIIVDNSSFLTGTPPTFWQIILAGASQTGGYDASGNLVDKYYPGGPEYYQTNITVTFAQLGWTNASDTYFQINFGANSDGGNPVNYYIDNLFVGTGPGPVPPLPSPQYTNTFDTAASFGANWIQKIQWSAGPVGWAGDPGTLQSADTMGNYTVGGGTTSDGGGPKADFNGGSGGLDLITSLIANGNAHLSFDVVLDSTSFPSGTPPSYANLIVADQTASVGYFSQPNLIDNMYTTWGGSGLYHANFDFTFAQLGWTNAADGYFQFFIGANSNPGIPIDYYIDNFAMYVPSSVSTATLTITNTVFIPGTGLRMTGTGSPEGSNWRCLSSSSVSAARNTWTQVGSTFSISGGTFTFTDGSATAAGGKAKFYLMESQ